MDNKGYIGIPIGIAFFIELIYPYMRQLGCKDVWFSPPKLFCLTMFIGSFIFILCYII